MRKNLFLILMSVVTAFAFSACSDDNKDPNDVETLNGIYVINSGNMRKNIPGSITAYDFTNKTTTQRAFFTANGQELGSTPQSALIYDGKMYIAAYQSNLIWVVDPTTLKVIKSIRSEEEDVESPRYMTAKDGKVYASMFSGHVVRIDAASLTIDATVKVGPNPEQLAIAGNKLYVCNTDGMNHMNNYANGYISIVNLSTMKEENKIQGATDVLNPTYAVSNGTDVFVICQGNYGDIPSTVKKINGTNVTDICPGTMMDIRGNELYVVNAPYGAETFTYEVYSTTTGSKLRDMLNFNTENSKIEYPCGLAVDQLTGNIVLLSYYIDPASGYAQYAEPCYANVYNPEGNLLNRFETGVGSIFAVFHYSTETK